MVGRRRVRREEWEGKRRKRERALPEQTLAVWPEILYCTVCGNRRPISSSERDGADCNGVYSSNVLLHRCCYIPPSPSHIWICFDTCYTFIGCDNTDLFTKKKEKLRNDVIMKTRAL